jgi:ABC-type Fe3+-siderophore transport system permease subunit
MMLSLYVALGVFLLLAARNPSAHRSLIGYAGWANVAHATVMVFMAIHPASDRRDLLTAAAMFGPVGVTLIALTPAKSSGERVSTTEA